MKPNCTHQDRCNYSPVAGSRSGGTDLRKDSKSETGLEEKGRPMATWLSEKHKGSPRDRGYRTVASWERKVTSNGSGKGKKRRPLRGQGFERTKDWAVRRGENLQNGTRTGPPFDLRKGLHGHRRPHQRNTAVAKRRERREAAEP